MAVPKEKLSSRRKLALIIVNGSYSQPYNRLEQVADNAKKISNSLKQINFDVATFYDLNKQNMTTCFMDFSEKIRDGDLVFVYFSGHACQVKGNNYFIPVQVEIESDRDIEDFSVNIERQLGRIAGQNPSWLTIFIVDCCKPYMMTNAKASKTTSEPKCLSKIEPPTGVFVEFACSIDEMIEAGPEISRSNLFAKRLLQNITRENVDFTNLFQDIADEVYKESGRRQRPFSMNGFRKRAQVYLNEVIKPPEPKPNPLDKEWNEQVDGSLNSAKKAQAQLKVYYETFPSIDDVANDKRPEVQEAKTFTKSILRNLPSGDVTERTTVCHILNNMFQAQNVQCLFFDGNHGNGLHDASGLLTELGSNDRPFVLKLNSSEGLGDSQGPKTQHGAIRQVQQLTDAIRRDQSHPILEDIKDRLAKSHRTNKENIRLKSISYGSFCVAYCKENWTQNDMDSLPELTKKLQRNFEQYSTAKIHPLLCRPAFDISMFDPRGNKTFPNTPEFHEVGPPGRKETYTSPAGWTRYGLKALGRYASGNSWLDPFGDPGNWYRAFHGTGRASAEDFKKSEQSFDGNYAPVDAMASIHKTGFRAARFAAYGAGVYCSPDPAFPEHGYVGTVPCDTQNGRKNFKCMLQVAVNPDGVQFTKDAKIWVVANPENIRPYGILIKEA